MNNVQLNTPILKKESKQTRFGFGQGCQMIPDSYFQDYQTMDTHSHASLIISMF
uniref:Uncharacterized protein n=1 Tax=Rhizophora mucronata TaxID=61149 RepID=A0A2P2PY32_RHIMU